MLLFNHIRNVLNSDDEYNSAVDLEDWVLVISSYLRILSAIRDDKIKHTLKMRKRKRKIFIIIAICGVITCIFAVCAALIYAVMPNSPSISFVLSICTGIFVFLTGCTVLIQEHMGYAKKIIDLEDETARLKIIMSSVQKVKRRSELENRPEVLSDFIHSTHMFYDIENEVFQVDDV